MMELYENDRVQIVSGPLTGMEGSIRRIDRHKRIAHLEIEMFGRTVRNESRTGNYKKRIMKADGIFAEEIL